MEEREITDSAAAGRFYDALRSSGLSAVSYRFQPGKLAHDDCQWLLGLLHLRHAVRVGIGAVSRAQTGMASARA